MRARLIPVVAVLLLVACGGSKQPKVLGGIAFRVLSEKQIATYCVEGPDFQLATNQNEWIDVYDRETECQPAHDIKLPDVDFKREAGLGAWWAVESCLGWSVHTDSIQRVGSQIVVSATAHGPSPGVTCASARGGLESFLVLERSDLFTGHETLKFVLNGATVGTEKAGGQSPG